MLQDQDDRTSPQKKKKKKEKKRVGWGWGGGGLQGQSYRPYSLYTVFSLFMVVFSVSCLLLRCHWSSGLYPEHTQIHTRKNTDVTKRNIIEMVFSEISGAHFGFNLLSTRVMECS